MLWTAPPRARECQGCGRRLRLPRFGGATCAVDFTIGLDIAKSVFQVHGVDAAGQVVLRRRLRRRYVFIFPETVPGGYRGVGIEACASSHYWSRELPALGHTAVDAAVRYQEKIKVNRGKGAAVTFGSK